MKTAAMLALMLLSSPVALAGAPGSLTAELPDLPDACNATRDEKRLHAERLAALEQRIDAELKRLRGERDADKQRNAQQMKAAAAQRAGLTAAEADRLGKASKEERRKIIEAQMQKQHGMSMEDLEKLKTMSPEARKRWAQSMMAQKQAEAAANPDDVRQKQAAADTGKRQLHVQRELRELTAELGAPAQAFAEKLKEADADPAAKEIRDVKLPRLEEKLQKQAEYVVISDADPEVKALKKAYCERLGTRHGAALKEYRTKLVGSVSSGDYERMDALSEELAKSAGGAAPPRDLAAIEAIRDYLRAQKDVFRYDLRADL